MLKDSIHPTTQEIRVLKAIIEHGTVNAAAQQLLLSPHTVDAHVDHLRSKSGRQKIVQVVAWAAENGWLRAYSDDLTGSENTKK